MSTPDTNNAGGGRGTVTMVLAASVLCLILIGSLLVWLTGRNNDPDTTSTPTSPAITAPDSEGPAPTGFGAPDVDPFGRRVDLPNNRYGQPLAQTRGPLAAGDPQWLTAAPLMPEQGGWQRVFGVSVPFSTSDGPTALVDNVPTGYSHTPQGAVLAAMYAAWQSYARPGDWSLIERMQVINPAGKAEYDRLKSAGKVPDLAPATVTKWLVAPDAFRIESWSEAGDLCVVEVATKKEATANGATQWRTSRLVMVWDGTWRLRLPSDGAIVKSTTGSLNGWTRW